MKPFLTQATSWSSPAPTSKKKIVSKSSNNDSFSDSDKSTDRTETNETATDVGERKQNTKKYKRKFNKNWIEQYPWVENIGDLAFCKCCNQKIVGSLTHLSRHEKTANHRKRMEAAKSSCKITSLVKNDKKLVHQKNVYATELKMTMFLHEHNFPFLLMEHLPKFVQSACPDSSIAKDVKCSRTKANLLTTTCLAKESLEVLQKQLENSGGLYSLIIDETTDVSTKKSLAVVIRFCNNDKPIDRFLGLIEVISATAESLFNAVVHLLNDNKIPLQNMIGFAGDNASVMMGKKAGVQAKFREINQDIFVLGCTCHSLHLCSSAACTKLPKSVEEFVRNLYNHFSNSPRRVDEFEEYQKFLQLKPHKLLRPAQTRWLSLQAVVDRILFLWESLQLYFTNLVFENKDILHSDQHLLENLNNPIFKLYLLFLSYILDIINQMNLQFQSESTQIHTLYTKFTSLYRTILKNFVKRSSLENSDLGKICPTNPEIYLDVKEIYMGANVALFLSKNNLDYKEVDKFQVNVLSFYVELSSQIRKRFQFNDNLLIFLSNFQPKRALSGDVATIVVEAKKFFQKAVSNCEKLDSEWRLLPEIADFKNKENLPFNEFWTEVFKSKNELECEMFPNLKRLVRAVMCLPHSSACAERIFSKLNLIKTDLRNRLNVATCNAIMLSCELLNNGESCYSWQPQPSLLKKLPKY